MPFLCGPAMRVCGRRPTAASARVEPRDAPILPLFRLFRGGGLASHAAAHRLLVVAEHGGAERAVEVAEPDQTLAKTRPVVLAVAATVPSSVARAAAELARLFGTSVQVVHVAETDIAMDDAIGGERRWNNRCSI